MPSKLTVLLATSAVTFCLLLMIVPARGSPLCPEKCQCDAVRHQVTCHGPSITTVPSIPLKDLRIFGLSHNNITLLQKDSFVSLTKLEVLGIWRCGLRTIYLGAFNGLTELRDLQILDNEISVIIPGTFENLSKLELLDLRANQLEHLVSNVFSGLVNLEYIDLSMNKLQYFHPDTFLGLPNIQFISLHSNPDLLVLNDRPFINSNSLSQLNISSCNISSVSVETFTNVSELEWLDLSYNNLRTLDINILTALPKLFALYLYGNPLNCDCQLQEVWRLCEDRNITTGYLSVVPECDTPSKVKGVEWGVLEKGECLEGNIEYYGNCDSASCSYTDIDNTDRKTQKSTDMDTQHNGKVSSFSTKFQVAVYAIPFIFYLLGLL